MKDSNIGEHQFWWKIENFSACTKQIRDVVSSPVIEAMNLGNSHWNVMMAPRSEKDGSFISLCLRRDLNDKGPPVLHLALEFCLIDLYGTERFKQQIASSIFTRTSNTGFFDFVRRSDVFKDKDTLLPNNVLTLQCCLRRYDHGKFSATRSVVLTKIRLEQAKFPWTIRVSTSKGSVHRRVVHIKSNVVPNGMDLSCEYDVPRETQRQRRRFLRLAMTPKSVPDNRIYISAWIQALDSHRKPRYEIKADHFFEAGSCDTWHLPSFDISDKVATLLEGDRLDLECDFSISDGLEHTQTKETSVPLSDNFTGKENTLLQDIKRVYEGCYNADILLKAYNDVYHYWAHKMILSTRSSVFREILNHLDYEKKRLSGAESLTGPEYAIVVYDTATASVRYGVDYAQISHVDHRILRQMLDCMYTDELEPVSLSNAMQLYSAGVRFDFKLLREKSEVYLKDRITLSSLYLLLEFADSNGIVGLKQKCMNFVSENRKIISDSDEWVDFRGGHELLAQEVSNVLKSEDNVS